MYLPSSARNSLVLIGNQVRLARKRRLWTIADLAGKMGVSAPTVIALEKGTPTIGLGTLFSALWILGLEKEIASFSKLEDSAGIELMNKRLPQKVRTKRSELNNDF